MKVLIAEVSHLKEQMLKARPRHLFNLLHLISCQKFKSIISITLSLYFVSVTRWSRIRGERKERKHKLIQLAAIRKNEETEQSMYCGAIQERRRKKRKKRHLFTEALSHLTPGRL